MSSRRALVLRAGLLVVAWFAVAVPAAVVATISSSTHTVIAGHEVVVRPTLDGWARFDLGPYLPDFRYPSSSRVGVFVDVGKTTAGDYDRLIRRYAVIAAQAERQ